MKWFSWGELFCVENVWCKNYNGNLEGEYYWLVNKVKFILIIILDCMIYIYESLRIFKMYRCISSWYFVISIMCNYFIDVISM